VARTGRRPGTSGSRETILAAARARFASDGYDGATIRGIAGTAEVDPALVRHYFGNKERLFVAAMRFPADPAEMLPALIEPGVEGLGIRLASFFLQTWDTPDSPFVALLRSVTTNEQAAEMLRQFVTREVLGRVAAALQLDRPKLRAGLAASHLLGVALLRYVIKLEPLASMERDALAREVGPVIQRYFEPSTRA
jgi:AcrR family transcriptional regulator